MTLSKRKKAQLNWLHSLPRTKEWREKMRQQIKQRYAEHPELKKKAGESNIGKPSGSKGKHWKLSDEMKKRMSERQIKRVREGKHNFWKGGVTNSPYSVDWTRTLRRSIRERDKYVCQLCKKPQGDRALAVHHIDYNKKNCDPKNLITLCNNCHQKTNFNRDYWMKLLLPL